MRLFSKSIRSKLIFGTTFLFIVAFVSTSWFNYYYSSTEIEKRIIDYQLPSHIENIRAGVKEFINAGRVPNDVLKNNDRIKEEMTKQTPDTAYLNNYTQELQEGFKMWVGLVCDSSLLNNMNGSSRFMSKESDVWYQDFRKQPENLVHNLQFDIAAKQVRLWTNQKVFDKDDNYIGIVFTGLDVYAMKDFLMSKKFEGIGSIMVIDQKGSIKLHEDSTLMDINNTREKGKTLQSIDEYKSIAERVLVKDDVFFVEDNFNEESTLFYSIYIPEFKWYIIISLPEKQILKPARRILLINVSIAFFIILLVVVLNTFAINRLILKPFSRIINLVTQFSKGYLYTSLDVNRKDEIGVLSSKLNGMKDELRNIVGDINKTSKTILTASNELKVSAIKMSESSHLQAVNIEEVSSSMEEMFANINLNTDNAVETDSIARKVNEGISSANMAVEKTVEAMRNITEKVSDITNFAMRTDILAINASIEASRAGAAGKGFASVASSVRSLAESSQRTAKEIEELSGHSMQLAEESLNILREVLPEVMNTSRLLQQIALSSKEQRSGAENINQAILQLSEIAQDNASSAEQLAANSELFTDQAKLLNKNIAFFRLSKDTKKTKARRIKNEILRLQKLLGNFEDETIKNEDIIQAHSIEEESFVSEKNTEQTAEKLNSPTKKFDLLDDEFCEDF